MAGKGVMSLKDIKKRMAVSAAGQKSRLVTTGGNVIGTRNERFTFKNQIIGDEFTCTVLDFAHSNQYYGSEAFDPNNISPPQCMALSHDGVDMAPDASSLDVQNATCDGCPQNAFGSAEIGRGKACKNQYRLVVMPDGAEDAREAETAYLTLPPTSIKKWNEYVNTVAALYDVPVWGVRTTFVFENDDPQATRGILTPTLCDDKKGPVHEDPQLLSSIMDMEEQNRAQVLLIPDFKAYEDADDAPKGRRKSPAKKPAAKRGATKKAAAKKPAPKKKAAPKKKPAAKSRASRSKFS